MAEKTFGLSTLVARTRMPASTISHYRRLGLLPAPRRSGKRFLYDDTHVRALRLIRAIREKRSLSTSELRRILPRLLALEGDLAFRAEEWDRAIDEALTSRRPIPPADRLLAAAIEEFSRSGYADVNVEELCARARIAKGSFYQYYPSKEALLFTAAAAAGVRVLQGFHAAAGKRPLSKDRAVAILVELLEPRLPMFLEFVARALQRRPGHSAVARHLLGRLAHEIGGSVAGRGDALAKGTQVVELASAEVVRRRLRRDRPR